MSKIIEINHCRLCPYNIGNAAHYCNKTQENIDLTTLEGAFPSWCPLKDLPHSEDSIDWNSLKDTRYHK